MTAPSGISRRSFVHGSAAAALTAASYGKVLGANDRIGVGFLGFGLIGKRHVLDFQKEPGAHLVGVSDCHRGRLEEGQKLIGGNARGYPDFRRLLDDRDVQAVVISTPDHWHALMTMLACAAGKDIYVEKPLSLFVREGRWMTRVAERTRRVVQVGTQQRSGRHYARARDLLRAGRLGRIVSVRMHAYRNVMPGFGAPRDCDPPRELDWDMLQGPAPARPYNPHRGIYHFRWFWDYSGGQMTNLGHHSLDIVRWVLDADPLAVCSTGGRFALEDNGETPDTQDALFEFPAAAAERKRNRGVGWTASWSHREVSAGRGDTFSLEFFGTRGTMTLNRRGFAVHGDRRVPPANRIPSFAGAHPVGGPRPEPEDGRGGLWTEALTDDSGSGDEQFTLHVRNFLDCIRTRRTPVSDLESSHRVSTMCHLANLSLRLGRRLRWDAAQEEIVGDAEAARHLVRPYRAPWDRELIAFRVNA